MTDDAKNKLIRKPKANNEEADYPVGKSKPPKENRFKPGQSGNPHGRPLGSKNKPKPDPLSKMIVEKGNAMIRSRDGTLEKPVREVVLDSIVASAVKGVPRSQRLFVDVLQAAEIAEHERKYSTLELLIEYKAYWTARLAERKMTGTTGPEPNPHPDDIHVYYQESYILIYNLWQDHELAQQRYFEKLRASHLDALKTYHAELAEPDHEGQHEFIKADIAHSQKMLGLLEQLLAWRPSPVFVEAE